MIQIVRGIVLLALLAISSEAFAGKVDKVKKAVRDQCNKEIPIETLVTAVIRAYECAPDREVTIAGCKIKCLKDDDGSVVGK
jgi:hypothetical protein